MDIVQLLQRPLSIARVKKECTLDDGAKTAGSSKKSREGGRG